MKHPLMYGCVVFLCGALSGASLFGVYIKEKALARALSAPFVDSPKLSDARGNTQSKSILMVGDIMLARTVETHMREGGASYPFTQIGDFLRAHSAVVANFEGSIPETHAQTKPMNFTFSVDKDFSSVLKDYGITHLSLANNHSYDFGAEGYLHTRDILRAQGFAVGGDQVAVATSSTLYTHVEGLTIAVVPIYAVVAMPKLEELQTVFAYAASTSDVQIAFVHWGEEYQAQNTSAQETLAQTLIDLGADAVVGHHPHVVENIAEYKRVPIFYSLGNFIFDQYWNENVQTGLILELSRAGDGLAYRLVPVRSTASVPALMEGVERGQFLRQLAARSDPLLAKEIETGVIAPASPLLATDAK